MRGIGLLFPSDAIGASRNFHFNLNNELIKTFGQRAKLGPSASKDWSCYDRSTWIVVIRFDEEISS